MPSEDPRALSSIGSSQVAPLGGVRFPGALKTRKPSKQAPTIGFEPKTSGSEADEGTREEELERQAELAEKGIDPQRAQAVSIANEGAKLAVGGLPGPEPPERPPKEKAV